PASIRWSTNGSGAHPQRERALLHALLEAIERDQLARALPRGFTERALGERRLQGVPEGLQALCGRLRAVGLSTHLFDLAPGGPRDLGLPVAGALIVDEEHGPVPVAAGYACRLRRDEALQAALREAAQSRLTDVHGARDDV